MSDHIELTIDTVTGDLLIASDGGATAIASAGLGPGSALGCARPLAPLAPPVARTGGPRLRITDYYHGSLVDGPGRRSVVRCQGCPIGCPGCHVPETHPTGGGRRVAVAALAAALLDPAHPRDGVTLLGGEPTLQAEGVLALVRALRRRGCADIGLYSGYPLAVLARRAATRPALRDLLAAVDWLIDGPYRVTLAAGAPAWRGSRNQRFIRRPGRFLRSDLNAGGGHEDR
ncbi:MAG: radical SAM protein [Chloroflexi bacterium]|nr:radical SAM protein [Chloroflexota bacterium]